MAVLGVFLILIGLTLWVKNIVAKIRSNKKARAKTLAEQLRLKTDGERMENRYVLYHEQKVRDDAEYEEYLEWCNFNNEIPLDKRGFAEIRKKEELLKYKARKAAGL